MCKLHRTHPNQNYNPSGTLYNNKIIKILSLNNKKIWKLLLI
ncbi:hypothetical protein PL10110_530025 [Planktothrix agardhii]|nr:hypothetical protein PL10110_530025 [Planktothrix agardhii]